VAVNAADYDNSPVPAHVTVTMTETEEDNRHREYEETTTKVVDIGASGVGMAAFSCPRPGQLNFEADAYDLQNDKISSQFTVTSSADSNSQQTAQATLNLTLDKDSYSFGETAHVSVDTSLVGIKYAAATTAAPEQPAHDDAWALVTVEGEQLGLAKVIHLSKTHTTFSVPLTDLDYPSVELHVEVIEDHIVTDQEVIIPVQQNHHHLTVSVVPGKVSYQPGDAATYKVTTRDWQGRPVPAEVLLGIVDKSIYGIAPDNSPDIEPYFYAPQTVRINTDFSFAAQYSGGGFQTPSIVAISAGTPPPAPAADGIRVRKSFEDTAYWGPDLITGADGTASVSLTLPDNLTTWRATAPAITAQTAVGSATKDVVSVMPLLVKLELPRFVVQGDQCIFSAVIKNGTKVSRTVKVSATLRGATSPGDLQTTVQLPPNGQQRLDWPATITGPDTTVFEVTADGGPSGQDADQSTLPVLPAAVKVVTSQADELTASNPSQTIDLTKLRAGCQLKLTFSSSLAGSVYDSVDDLLQKPDHDAESVVAAMTADVAMAQALLSTGKTANRDVQKDVSLALQKLYNYQHPDGGRNLWEFDQSDGDVTASVLDALISARTCGFTVDQQRILRGTSAPGSLLHDQENRESQASWLETLSRTDDVKTSSRLEAIYRERADLDDYGKASLALGLL
jgi:alpha-2-macroglobulin